MHFSIRNSIALNAVTLLCTLTCTFARPAYAAGTLLYTNTCPAQAETSVTTKAGIQALQDAITQGYTIRVSFPETDNSATYYETITALRLQNGPSGSPNTYHASGLLAIQPPQNSQGQPIRKNGFYVASVDTNGVYYWGQYLLGSDTWGLSTATPTASASCFVVSWWKQ